MDLFKLPQTAIVDKVIPKNAFDEYANTKQKRLFTDLVSRITWTHKLSSDTVNLEAREIKEIQVFEIELKIREEIKTILDIIDKAIPYHIIFIVVFNGEVYISLSVKHLHPVNEDRAIIDWTFKSNWFSPSENKYTLQLKRGIDSILQNLCVQISENMEFSTKPTIELVEYKKALQAIETEIAAIKSKMASCRQFNEKVQLNLLLQERLAKLEAIRNA